jgi:peptidoglycan/xylan/chitin deacetylase (PgdA/CDA1 family)
LKYLYNPPFIIKKLFNDFYWNTSNNKILLTFDDGPTIESTEAILKVLNDFNIKAMFFCVGNNVKKHRGLTNSILSEGHTIANHTFNHKKLTGINIDETVNEIDSFNNLLREDHNYFVKYFRPPYGKYRFSTNKLLKQRNMKNVMWSLLTYDYKNDFNLVKFTIRNFLNSDSIIVLHDSIKSKNIITDSIKFIFDESSKRGINLGEPAECLK